MRLSFSGVVKTAEYSKVQTSLEAWFDYQPQIRDKQKQVYHLIKGHPHRTDRELDRLGGLLGGTARKRISELIKMGLVVEGRPKKCPISRQRARTTCTPEEFEREYEGLV